MSSTPSREPLLIIEPNWVVGYDLEMQARERGCGRVQCAATPNEALAWLKGNSPELAIIDYTHTDEFERMVDLLRQRGTHVVVYSALDRLMVDESSAAHLPWINKPGRYSELWDMQLGGLSSAPHIESTSHDVST